MFNFFTKRNGRALVLFSLSLIVACEKDVDVSNSQTTQSPHYQIPAYKHVYSDSTLKQVLKEELSLIRNGKNNNLSLKTDPAMEIDKSNPKKVYVHYLPWFQSKPHDGYWGQHWTMANKNPDNIDENGLHEIASYYNPLIGPYSSSDPDLQEYHFLLMKLSGIDGVIFDWYGSRNMHDFGLIKSATETFITELENIDLDFSIMYEDRVAYMEVTDTINNPIARAQEDFSYIKDTYFTSPNYQKINNSKIISMFGPHHLNNTEDWNTIYNVFDVNDQPALISLWGLSHTLSEHFKGEFLWVAPDHLIAHDYYYQTYAENNEITIGSAYPGFKSFYVDGGWTEGINLWELPENDGLTFVESLNNSSFESADVIQIVTWNDFGEGTMVEPTTQFGFRYLTMLQEYTGTEHTEDDLLTATRLYESRKENASNDTIQAMLDNSYKYMKELRIERVNMVLQAIELYQNEL